MTASRIEDTVLFELSGAARPLKTGCYQASVFDTFLRPFRRIGALRRRSIASNTSETDPRLGELRDWLSGFDRVAGAEFTVASEDASFRRYFRLTMPGESLIVMDAPPPQEDCRPFVKVASYLEAIRLKPDYARARYNLAMLMIRQGQREEARNQYRMLLDLDPALARQLSPHVSQ